MKNHRKTIKLYFQIIFLGLLVIQSTSAAEPNYKGHPLSEWLLVMEAQHWAHYGGIPAGMEDPEAAIQQIGTNAIPTLLNILGATERSKSRVLAKLKSRDFRNAYSDSAGQIDDFRRVAVDGFGVIGTNAESAVPQLTKLFHDQETCFEATRALIRVGPQGFAVLTNALNDNDSSVRNSLIWVVGQEGGGDPQAVTALLVRALKDPDAVNRGNAATFLGGRDPAVAIPALISLLDENHTNFVTVTGAAKGLSSYGPAAKVAAPLLLSIYTNTWDIELMWALKAIDIESAAKAENFLVNSGPLNSARTGYTKTLLPNGKELIAGGYIHTEIPTVQNRNLSRAELLDPVTGKWTETGEMHFARYNHKAVLQPDGKVLVTGGFSEKYGDTLTSQESYDSATGLWTVITNK